MSVEVGESCSGAREVKAFARRPRPRVVILLVQHRDEQREEPHALLRVVSLPHRQLEVGHPRRVELAHRPGAAGRRDGEGADSDHENQREKQKAPAHPAL